MGLINPRDVLAISDRIGKRYYFTLMAAVSGSSDSASVRGEDFYAMCHICPDGDPEVETSTLSSANTSDNAWNTTTNAWAIASSMMGSMSSSYSIIGALTNHFGTATSGGQQILTGSWNQYLETADPTGTPYVDMPTIVSNGTGVRISEYFRRVANIGNLRARNVFYDSPDAFEFVLIEGTGASSVTFTELGDFGNGTINETANGAKFAATRMKLVVEDGSSWSGGAVLELSLVTEPNGDVVTETVDTSSLSTAGDSIEIGSLPTDRYTKVNGITVTSGTTPSGGQLVIQNIFERTIDL